MEHAVDFALDLAYPEGPVAMPDGSVVCSEVAGGRISHLNDVGLVVRAIDTGGSPAGCAVGPDKGLYVCNGGGTRFRSRAGSLEPYGPAIESAQARIEKVDLDDGTATRLYDECDGEPLSSPNDLVFDDQGGFYFTDFGRTHANARDLGSVYYAQADGSSIQKILYPLETPNGIGLSPDGRILYVAETVPGRLWSFEVIKPGQVRTRDDRYARGELLLGLAGLQCFDSLAVQADGSVCVATLVNGGVTRVSPSGDRVEHIPFPDNFTTNLCFGGADLMTAYVTLSSSQKIVSVLWDAPGLQLNYG